MAHTESQEDNCENLKTHSTQYTIQNLFLVFLFWALLNMFWVQMAPKLTCSVVGVGFFLEVTMITEITFAFSKNLNIHL